MTSKKLRNPESFEAFLLLFNVLFVFLYDLVHLWKFFLHIFYQCQLCSAAIQIMSFTMDLKVMIPLQIVGKETDSVFECHKYRTQRKCLNLQICQRATAALNKAFCINFK